MLRDTGIVGLVEPIGLSLSSLRYKAEAADAIEYLDGREHFKLLHETFQHVLAGDPDIFPTHVGIVYISGISDPNAVLDEKLDAKRGLIDENDRVNHLAQIATFLDRGYNGILSFGCMAPRVHVLTDPEADIRRSFNYLPSRFGRQE